jgi:DNA topoisomerase-2
MLRNARITAKDVKVFLNDKQLKIKNFKQYIDMYLDSDRAEAEDTSGGGAQPKQVVIYKQIGPCWEVAFAVSDGTFQVVSFANSISTTKGQTKQETPTLPLSKLWIKCFISCIE